MDGVRWDECGFGMRPADNWFMLIFHNTYKMRPGGSCLEWNGQQRTLYMQLSFVDGDIIFDMASGS